MRILNFGSLNLDRVYDVDHFVLAEETILAEHYEAFFGGKGLNQSVAAARAGARVFHAGAIGGDGACLRDFLEQSGAEVSHIRQLDCPSGHAIIQSVRGQNCIIVYGGANQRISESQIDETVSAFSAGDLLLLQNEISCVPYAIQRARRQGMRVAFNASPITPDILEYPLECVDYFLINEIEGRALCGEDGLDNRELLEALVKKFPRAAIVLTVGSDGVYYGRGDVRLSHRAYDVPVIDTTGAGDTFCGYFLAGLAGGRAESEALELASLASGLAVSRKGAANSIPTLEEVEEFRNSQRR